MASPLIQRHKDMFNQDLTALGGVLIYCIVSLFFLIDKDYITFLRLIVGFIAIYTLTILIRSLYFKERPIKYSHSNIIEKLDASSFPSLHSARGTFLSLILINFFNNIYFTIIIAIVVIGIAYSRMYLKKHDIKDVSVGIIIGLILYWLIT